VLRKLVPGDGNVIVLTVTGSNQSEVSGAQQAIMEANLSVEVAMIVLDTVTLYINSFKVIGQFNSLTFLFLKLVSCVLLNTKKQRHITQAATVAAAALLCYRQTRRIAYRS